MTACLTSPEVAADALNYLIKLIKVSVNLRRYFSCLQIDIPKKQKNCLHISALLVLFFDSTASKEICKKFRWFF
jgi:hypothetical protein